MKKCISIVLKTAVIFCSIATDLYGYNFANVAKQVLHRFETQQIRSNFGNELYAEIEHATNNFTNNLTFEELKRKNVNPIYLDYMTTEIAATNKNSYMLVIWPVTVEKDELINQILNKYCNVISYKRILMNQQAARNFLNQIPEKATHSTGVELWFALPYRNYNPMRVYLIECKPNDTNLEIIRNYLTGIFSNNRKHIKDFEQTHGTRALQNLYTTTICKREIRKAVHIDHALHICDTTEETLELAQMLFNENSIKCLKFSNPQQVKTLSKFNTYTPMLKQKLGQSIDQLVVYNSAVLSAFGLRDCNDIDFLHDPRMAVQHNLHPQLSNQNQFFKRLYVILEDLDNHTYILEDCPQAFSNLNLDECSSFRKKISIDELLYNPKYYFYFHKVKYATLEFMHYFKKSRGRVKDLRDVKLMEEHFANRY